jgi:hypothetical protein
VGAPDQLEEVVTVWRRRHRPDPPVGVRAAYPDGTESPDLPVVYLGVVDGLDAWEVMLPDSRPIAGVHADVMPGTSSLQLYLPPEQP